MNRNRSLKIVLCQLCILIIAGMMLVSCQMKPLNDDSPVIANDGTDSIKLMSFNIRNGRSKDGENGWVYRDEMVYDLIRNQSADVVGLQEPYKFQLDDMLEALPEYKLIGVGREDGKEEGEYSPLLYRADKYSVVDSGTFWLSNSPEVPGSKDWDTACTRVCSWAHFVDKLNGQQFYVYNAHMDHISQKARQNSAILIMNRASQRKDQDVPFVIMGDFNAGEDNATVQYLLGNIELKNFDGNMAKAPQPRISAYRKVNPDETVVGTFHGFKGTTGGNKIDYVLLPPNSIVKSSEIIRTNDNGRYPSDHYPVIAEVIFPAD